jgi:hypothetical protein
MEAGVEITEVSPAQYPALNFFLFTAFPVREGDQEYKVFHPPSIDWPDGTPRAVRTRSAPINGFYSQCSYHTIITAADIPSFRGSNRSPPPCFPRTRLGIDRIYASFILIHKTETSGPLWFPSPFVIVFCGSGERNLAFLSKATAAMDIEGGASVPAEVPPLPLKVASARDAEVSRNATFSNLVHIHAR